MRAIARVRAIALAVSLAGLGVAEVQAAPPPPPSSPSADSPTVTVDGEVARYLTTAYGDPNGLRLIDGTLVLIAPHLGARLSAAIAPGERVRVSGQTMADGAVRAVSLVNLSTGATFDDAPAGPPPARAKPRAPLQRLEAAGTIDLVLRGPRGEANGVILSDGSVIYFRPDLVRAAPARGQSFAAVGIGTRGASGVTLEAIVTGTDLATARAAASGKTGKAGTEPPPPALAPATAPPAIAPAIPSN